MIRKLTRSKTKKGNIKQAQLERAITSVITPAITSFRAIINATTPQL